MKFAQKIFPKGTFNKQQTDGAYLDENLADNLDTYAKKIADDMHFLLIISGNDGVGNGKTTIATQVGSYLTWKVNQLHKTNNTFTHKNMVFKADKLMDRSFELDKYSVVVLDEGDDLTTHGMKETAVRLKRYFRKCRQLNQILILILPSFFELPKFFALSRSHALINVKFLGKFERGFFEYYGPKNKKLLYLKGKKEWDYNSYPSNIKGRFFSSYCFFPQLEKEIAAYKSNKYKDMVEDNEDTVALTPKEVELKTIKMIFYRLIELGYTVVVACQVVNKSERTGYRWLNELRTMPGGVSASDNDNPPVYNNNINVIPDKIEDEPQPETLPSINI